MNDHQDDLDKYANQFRALGNYKGDIFRRPTKLNDVNAAIPSLNEKAKLILALNEYMPNIEKLLDVASNDIPAQFLRLIEAWILLVRGLI